MVTNFAASVGPSASWCTNYLLDIVEPGASRVGLHMIPCVKVPIAPLVIERCEQTVDFYSGDPNLLFISRFDFSFVVLNARFKLITLLSFFNNCFYRAFPLSHSVLDLRISTDAVSGFHGFKV